MLNGIPYADLNQMVYAIMKSTGIKDPKKAVELVMKGKYQLQPRANKSSPQNAVATEMVIGNLSTDQIENLVRKISRRTRAPNAKQAIELATSGQWIHDKRVRCWKEKDRMIHLTVRSEETNIRFEWRDRLESRGFKNPSFFKIDLTGYQKLSAMEYQIQILRPEMFKPEDLYYEHIISEAKKMSLMPPSLDVFGLTRELVTDEDLDDMCLEQIAFMHDPKPAYPGVGVITLTSTNNGGIGHHLTYSSLIARVRSQIDIPKEIKNFIRPPFHFSEEIGFAFVHSQKMLK